MPTDRTIPERPNFEGFPDRECGEHRTVGPHRAWCHSCTTWCYPDAPCPGCEVVQLRQALTDRTIPEAMLYRAANALVDRWDHQPYEGQTAVEDAETVLTTISPLTGPGPNGEWGRWELAGWTDAWKGYEPVYRFIPEATDE